MKQEERLSVRQLSVAAFAAGWAPAVSAAGYGWQGAALAVPVVLLAGAAFIRLWSRWERAVCTVPGKALQACYTLWGGMLLSRGLRRCGERLEMTGGGEEGTAVWIILLVTLLLLWMAWGHAGAFFRMAELCALAVLGTVAVVLVWGAFRAGGQYLLLPAESISGGFWAVVEVGGVFLFLLPYINKTESQREDGARAFVWLSVVTVGTAVLAAVTAGVLSPAVAAQIREPFFVMTATLGRSFRVEGLISSLWLISDLIYFGLLAQCGRWKGTRASRLPVAVVIFAAVGAIFNFYKGINFGFWAAGTVVLGGATLLLMSTGGRNSGHPGGGKTTSCGSKQAIKKDQEI